MLLSKVSIEQTGRNENASDINEMRRCQIPVATITSLTDIVHAFLQSHQANPEKIPTVHRPGNDTLTNMADAHAKIFMANDLLLLPILKTYAQCTTLAAHD
jgi:hypothetical protein